MPDYRRNRVRGGTYFFTVNLLERRSDLLVVHIDALREAVRKIRLKRPFHIDAWVVLPDHMHAVWTLPPDDSDYSTRWKAIKIAFAKPYRKQNADHQYVSPKVSAVSGNEAFGNARSATNGATPHMWITSISIL